jgi:hypothetical protein
MVPTACEALTTVQLVIDARFTDVAAVVPNLKVVAVVPGA